MKLCKKCGVKKSVDNFTKDRKRADGLNYYCKVCTRAASAAYHEAKPEAAKARSARWAAANPGRQRARRDAYYANNAEKMANWHANYRVENREMINAKAKAVRDATPEYQKAKSAAWYAANKTRALAKWARREALKLQATPAWADSNRIASFYESADGLRMLLGEWYEVDHVVPLRSPLVCGLHNEFNLQILTERENRAKGNRYWPGMWGAA